MISDRLASHTRREDDYLVNPYHPNNFESGTWFYREDITEKIKDAFENQPENKFIIIEGSPGAGKTSTLKYIERNPEKIGKNYIPIYLDSRDYIGLDADNLLAFVYDAIYVKLKELGYLIQKLDNIKESLTKGFKVDVPSVLLNIDIYLEDDVLILMVDEFDNLLENTEVKTISKFIGLFQNIEKNWSNYALIIAADKSPINLTDYDIIRRFLKIASHIEIDGFLEEKAVERYITAPLKDRITYDDDAIRDILWYSGGHPYFQQLICFYIVKALDEENRNRCSREDVEKAIQNISRDSEGNKRPEFVFTWENKMSIEIRLIASALVDENKTEKRKNSYFLKENSLLKNIFSGEIYKEIKKFPGSSYFNKMKDSGFPGFPLRAPLLGLWIRKEHPFIKTIIEHIDYIAEKIDMEAIGAEIIRAPSNILPPLGREAILKISQNWRLLEESITVTPRSLVKNHIELFRKSLSTLLNLEIKESKSDGNYFILDIKNLNIGILEEAHCFIQDSPEITVKDIFNIENIATSVARDTKTQLTIYFYFRKAIMVEALVKKTYLNLIAIDSIDLKKIIFSTRPRETTRKIILSDISLQKVSPYQTDGPTKTTFYGRAKIIDHITRSTSTSYSIVGARKIGKTSLLLKICDFPPPKTYYIFMNLDSVFRGTSNYKPFLKSLEVKIEEIFNEKVNLVRFTMGKSPYRLARVIRKLSQEGKKIIFVFDEVDILIRFDRDHGYKLLHIFRTMSQSEEICQFIIAGFKTLYHRKREIENPLYNFSKEIMLEPLDKEAALDLITKPMESIGVHYQDEEDRGLILKYTACHPNLLQFYCEQLIEKIEGHVNVEERRTIFKSDILDLFNTAYEEYIMDKIYMFWSDLTNIDRLILILLVEEQPTQSNGGIFSYIEIRDKLIKQGVEVSIEKVHRDLRNLVMRFILLDKGRDNYCFALPFFPGILKKRIDNNLKKAIVEEIKKEIKSNESKSL